MLTALLQVTPPAHLQLLLMLLLDSFQLRLQLLSALHGAPHMLLHTRPHLIQKTKSQEPRDEYHMDHVLWCRYPVHTLSPP